MDNEIIKNILVDIRDSLRILANMTDEQHTEDNINALIKTINKNINLVLLGGFKWD